MNKIPSARRRYVKPRDIVLPGGDAGSAGRAYGTIAGPVGARLRGINAGGVADNAEDFRFAEVLPSKTTVKSPQCGKPPH
jgi:hypothetical protein